MTLNVEIKSMNRFSRRQFGPRNSIIKTLQNQNHSDYGVLIENFSISLETNQVLAIMGESGIGKTTLLRAITGLEKNFVGSIRLNGKPIRVPSRRLYLMPQDHGLIPWMTLTQNLEFCCNRATSPFSNLDVLERLGLLNIQHQYPKTLSSGERARGALACAIVANPEVLLLDEPFKSLDSEWRRKSEDLLLSWFHEPARYKSIILVSHFTQEAIFLGDKLIILSGSPFYISHTEDTSSIHDRNSPVMGSLVGKINNQFGEVISPTHNYDV